MTFGFYNVLINRQKALEYHKGMPICPEKRAEIRKHHKGIPVCPENRTETRKGAFDYECITNN